MGVLGVVECIESGYNIYFWLGQFCHHVFLIFFARKKPKFGKNGKSRCEKYTFLASMKGLSKSSFHGSVEKQFDFQVSVKPNVYLKKLGP